MKKIILHLGPPKTGTTTIQEILTNELSNNYLGNLSNNTTLTEKMISYIKGDLKANLKEIKSEIESLYLNSESSLIYSDERVLLEYTTFSNWNTQLRKLFDIFRFDNIALEVVLCLRNPKDALPSLFQQLRNIKWISKLSLSEFLTTRQASIFNYNVLEKELINSGFSNISYYNFEILKDKQLDLSLFGINYFVPLKEVRNKSKIVNSNRVYNYTAADVFRRNFGAFSSLVPVKFKIIIAKKLNFKIKSEGVKTSTTLIPSEFIEAYNSKIV